MKTNREERLAHIENLLQRCEADLERMREMNAQLKQIIEATNELSAYYADEYMEDYENQDQFKNSYQALNQDSIWNVIADQHLEKIVLMKTLINSIEG